MPYIEVEVDLDEFETCELCDELLKRFESVRRNQVTKKQKEELKEAITKMVATLGIVFGEMQIKSLDDRLKSELLESIWNKYTYYQLEKKLKP